MTAPIGLTHEQEPFTMTLTLPAFLDALDKRMNDWMQKFGVGEPAPMLALQNMIRHAREDVAQHPTPALGWSEWLDWAGGPCPLPDTTGVEVELVSGVKIGRDVASALWWAHNVPSTGVIKRFRYRTDDPSGWLPRGDFVPPDALWDEACPVRCEWSIDPDSGYVGTVLPSRWDTIIHIRLVAREKACEMQEGWRIDKHGILRSPLGVVVLSLDQFKRYGPDTIRRAVDAWLRQMERGNG